MCKSDFGHFLAFFELWTVFWALVEKSKHKKVAPKCTPKPPTIFTYAENRYKAATEVYTFKVEAKNIIGISALFNFILVC